MTVATLHPVTVDAIRLVKTLGRPTGDAETPDGPTPPPASFYPYAVIYAGTVRMQGSLLDPKEDGLHRVQVTCVGKTRASAESLRDDALALLLDPDAWTIDGHAVVWTEHAGSPNTFRDDDVKPVLFSAVGVANVMVTLVGGS